MYLKSYTYSEWLKKCKFSEERKEDPQKIVAHWGGEFSLKMRLTLGTCLTMLAVTCSDRQTDTKTNIHRDGRELTPPKNFVCDLTTTIEMVRV